MIILRGYGILCPVLAARVYYVSRRLHYRQSSVKRIGHRQLREKGERSRDADCAYTQRIWMIFTLNDISAHRTQRVITSCKGAVCRVATALEQWIFTLPPLR